MRVVDNNILDGARMR